MELLILIASLCKLILCLIFFTIVCMDYESIFIKILGGILGLPVGLLIGFTINLLY